MKTKITRFTFFFITFLLMISCASEENLSSENTIQSFSITKASITKEFSITENSINGIVESSFDLEDLNLLVSIPKGSKISPDPKAIKSINGPLIFVVTAENGQTKNYIVDIKREPSTENSILDFNIKTPNLTLSADIDNVTRLITKRIPESNDIKNLNIELKFSKHATITPDPKTIKGYSSAVNFTVKSESGVEKVYQVKVQFMDADITRSCSEQNGWKWFGGDDRPNAPDILPYDRNIGTGQIIVVNKNLVPSSFSIHLREGFSYFDGGNFYGKPVTIKLIIKKEDGTEIATTTKEVSGQFSGGFIAFDLQTKHLYLEAEKKYVFYWYLVDGAKLGISASSSANTEDGSGFCFNSGYSGEAYLSKQTDLEQAKAWYPHPWHFNIELVGKE